MCSAGENIKGKGNLRTQSVISFRDFMSTESINYAFETQFCIHLIIIIIFFFNIRVKYQMVQFPVSRVIAPLK